MASPIGVCKGTEFPGKDASAAGLCLASVTAGRQSPPRSKGISAMHAKVIIVGSGPAGSTAAIYAARAMLEPVMISGVQAGGQLTDTTDVENYPGFADVIQGPWLMDQMRLQAEDFGTRIVTDHIVSVDFARRPFRLVGDSGTTYTAETVILATGAVAKWMNIP